MNLIAPTPARQGGYALITVIIFLVLLSIIALSTLKNSGLEARMGANGALHAQAFESSEMSRHLIDTLIDANVTARGWPASIGGSVANGDFDCGAASLLIIAAASNNCTSDKTANAIGYSIVNASSAPQNWFNGNTETSFNPNSLDTDANYKQALDSTHTVTGAVSVYKLYTTLAAGAGSQQAAGYLGLGRSAAAGGGYIFFYINSHGLDFTASPQASADTSAIFRDLIRN